MTSHEPEATPHPAQDEGGDPKSVGEILDHLDRAGADEDRVQVQDIVEAMGHRTYGPFLMVPALLELSPLGGIPGVPTVLALIILLFAVQMLMGRNHMWLPGWIGHRHLKAERLNKATKAMRPVARVLDRMFHDRLIKLTQGPFVQVAAVICIVLTLTVPPLELLPLASAVPMGVIALIGLALTVRDGALMIGALVLLIVGTGVGAYFLA